MESIMTNHILADFKSIASDEAMLRYLDAYHFEGLPADSHWNIGVYRLVLEDTTYTLGYRWYDPTTTFSIRKNIHQAELRSTESNGKTIVHGEVSFE